MDDLKPCPFCGRDARLACNENENLSFGAESYVIAMCRSCGIRTPNIYYVPKQGERIVAEMMASKLWNRRANDE